MTGIVWLASYPKSGNTWLRVLLTNYLSEGDEPADINKLIGGPIASARLWFDEWVGVEASSLDRATVDRLRPEVYRRLAAESEGEGEGMMFMKVHDAWSRTDAGESMFPTDATAGVVYVMRNPLDMAASVANHYGTTIGQAVEQLCDPADPIPDAVGRLHEQLHQRLGSWSGHVRSWVDESGLPVHVVRYEDLRSNTAAAFAEVVGFAGLDLDKERITKAVAFSAFDRLRGQEAKVGFRERSACANGEFFRKGQVGAWRGELGDDLVQRLTAACAETMARFGYCDPCDGFRS